MFTKGLVAKKCNTENDISAKKTKTHQGIFLITIKKKSSSGLVLCRAIQYSSY